MSWNQWHSSQSSWPSWGQHWSNHKWLASPGSLASNTWKTVLKGLLKVAWDFPQVLIKSAKEFYDSHEIFGVKFPRKIQPSKRATKHGLAGRNTEDMKLHELSWQGRQNYNLRALAQGRYVSINFTRSIKEATFLSYLLQHLREQKLDLDQVAECFCADSGIQDSSVLRHP